jgi:hypothetical protein
VNEEWLLATFKFAGTSRNNGGGVNSGSGVCVGGVGGGCVSCYQLFS